MQMQGRQERRLHLEEKVQRVRQELREMKNTLEKFTASIQVRHCMLSSRSRYTQISTVGRRVAPDFSYE